MLQETLSLASHCLMCSEPCQEQRRDNCRLGQLANILFLGGVGLKVPGLSIGVDLAMLLKHGGILSGGAEVLSDNGINAVP